MLIFGTIPFEDFKEQLNITKKLKKEFGKVKISIADNLIFYEHKTKEKDFLKI